MKGEKGEYIADKVLLYTNMGVVYLGHDVKNNNSVILKSIRFHGDGKDNIRSDLLQVETEVMRVLESHESIVKYIDKAEVGNKPYLVLDFIPGRRVQEAFDGNPIGEKEAVDLTFALLKAVQHLHENGIVHRDINPLNLILYEPSKLVLLDFGTIFFKENAPITKLMNKKILKKARARLKVGTHGFHAPEQFQDNPSITEASDIYSVGAIMFYMLTGKRPHDYTNGGDQTKALHYLKFNIGRDLYAVIERALQRKPSLRYQSIEEMSEALSQFSEEAQALFRNPYISIDDEIHDIKTTLEIGRKHSCGEACRMKGFNLQPDICLEDPNRFISRHHLRISRKSNKVYSIVDLNSCNKTAVGKGKFKVINPNRPYKLNDGDRVALCYSPKKGPYRIFTFHEK